MTTPFLHYVKEREIGSPCAGNSRAEFLLTVHKLPFTIIDVQTDDIRGRPVIEVL